MSQGPTIPGPILHLHGAPQPREPPSGGGLLAAVVLHSQMENMAQKRSRFESGLHPSSLDDSHTDT